MCIRDRQWKSTFIGDKMSVGYNFHSLRSKNVTAKKKTTFLLQWCTAMWKGCTRQYLAALPWYAWNRWRIFFGVSLEASPLRCIIFSQASQFIKSSLFKNLACRWSVSRQFKTSLLWSSFQMTDCDSYAWWLAKTSHASFSTNEKQKQNQSHSLLLLWLVGLIDLLLIIIDSHLKTVVLV